jgi:transposase
MAGAPLLSFWTTLLDLPGFVVTHLQVDSNDSPYRVTLVPEHAIGVCPHCGRTSQTVKQRRTRDGIRDLAIGTHAVELTVRVSQFACDHCQRCFTPPTDFLADGAHATERFLATAAALVRHTDIANAARFFGVPEKTLEGWYYDHVERQRAAAARTPTGPIRRIGIDELSLKSGTGSSSP